MSRELEGLADRMKNRMRQWITLTKSQWQQMNLRLEYLNPRTKLGKDQMYLDELSDRMRRAIQHRLEQYQHRYVLLTEQLHRCSPTAKLIHGYGYIETGKQPLCSIGQVSAGDRLTITIQDGQVWAAVTEVRPTGAPE